TIESIACDLPSYGYRRITAALRRKGMVVNHKKVAKIMKKMGLQCRKKKRFVSTTDSKHSFRTYPNLAKNLVLERTDQLWCADITYIRILTGFVYLEAIIDAFSRKIVGYALGRTLAAELALEALKVAIIKRNTDNLIHHSDQGIQYCSYDYINLLNANGILISMSAKGSPYDNAFIESFFKTLKGEEVYLWEYETYGDAIERIPYFIEDVYNTKRLHSSIGYLPP
ncbi:MAG: IS3 family transposase, partial [Actinobacteria bacterium]|nr:IS3 family transposase [Actinomycetota bacterium]